MEQLKHKIVELGCRLEKIEKQECNINDRNININDKTKRRKESVNRTPKNTDSIQGGGNGILPK